MYRQQLERYAFPLRPTRALLSESVLFPLAVYFESLLTDSDWLDLDAFLDMRIRCIIIILAREHLLAAEGVDESCSAFSKY